MALSSCHWLPEKRKSAQICCDRGAKAIMLMSEHVLLTAFLPSKIKIITTFNRHTSEQNPSSELLSVKDTAELVRSGGNRLRRGLHTAPSLGSLWAAVIEAALRTLGGVWGLSEARVKVDTQSGLHLPVSCACGSDPRWPSSGTDRTKEGERKSSPGSLTCLEPGICLTHVCLSTQDLSEVTQQHPQKLSQGQLPWTVTVRLPQVPPTFRTTQEMSQGKCSEEKKKNTLPPYKMLTHG